MKTRLLLLALALSLLGNAYALLSPAAAPPAVPAGGGEEGARLPAGRPELRGVDLRPGDDRGPAEPLGDCAQAELADSVPAEILVVHSAADVRTKALAMSAMAPAMRARTIDLLAESWATLSEPARDALLVEILSALDQERDPAVLGTLAALVERATGNGLPPPSPGQADMLGAWLRGPEGGAKFVVAAWLLRPTGNSGNGPLWAAAISSRLGTANGAELRDLVSVMRARDVRLSTEDFRTLARAGAELTGPSERRQVFRALCAGLQADTSIDTALAAVQGTTGADARQELIAAFAESARRPAGGTVEEIKPARELFLRLYREAATPSTRRRLAQASLSQLYLWAPGDPDAASFLMSVAELEPDARLRERIAQLSERSRTAPASELLAMLAVTGG